jgi:RimJ/RimL family protein N-acetyltransferase
VPEIKGQSERVRLTTERLVLRMPVLADASAAAALLTDPEVMRFLGGEVVPVEDVGTVVAKWIERWSTNGVGQFAVERREDRRFLGRVGIVVWDERTWTHATFTSAGSHAQPELGWALAREHWGRGYATEAARVVRDWARGALNFRRLISLISPENVASAAVARRLGAVPTERVKLVDSGDADVWEYPNTHESVG